MSEPANILDEAKSIYKERNQVYCDNHIRFGEAMAAIFKEGLQLKTAEDFSRYYLITQTVSKITRYCAAFPAGGHRDSGIDPINYLAMLTSLDDSIQQTLCKTSGLNQK